MGIGKLLDSSMILINKVYGKYKLEAIKIIDSQDISISELQRSLKISYKETHRHIKELVTLGLVKTEKKIKLKHAPVMVSLTEEGDKIYQSIKDGNINLDKVLLPILSSVSKQFKK